MKLRLDENSVKWIFDHLPWFCKVGKLKMETWADTFTTAKACL